MTGKLLEGRADYRFALLFYALLLAIFVPAVLEPGTVLHAAVLITLVVTLAAGLWAVAESRRQRLIGLAVLALSLALVSAYRVTDAVEIHVASIGAVTVFFVYVALRTLVFVLKARRVDANILYAAVSVYLLIGYVFGGLYHVVYLLGPESFAGPLDPSQAETELTYFSFVTLTTLGYGDIQPAHEVPRALAMIEALLGQLFLVILIARLVALHVAHTTVKAED